MRWVSSGRNEDLVAAAAALTQNGGHFVLGEPGVGKSTFVHQLDRHVRTPGPQEPALFDSVVHLQGSAGLGRVPFGALADLLPPREAPPSKIPSNEESLDLQRDELVRNHQALARRFRGDKSTLVIVDNADLLDTLSVELIRRTAMDTTASFKWLLVARSAADLAAQCSDLWGRNHWALQILQPLTFEQVSGVIQQACGGLPADTVLHHIYSATKGNPFLLHEFILGADDVDALQLQDGQVSGQAQLVIENRAWTNPRLCEAVAHRIGHLSEPERTLLEFLAIADRAQEQTVVTAFGETAVDSLERRHLIRNTRDGFELAQPLYREVLAAEVSPRRQRYLLVHVVQANTAWIDQVVSDGLLNVDGGTRLMQLVAWDLHADEQMTPQAYLSVARLAATHNQLDLARRCVTALQSSDAAVGSDLTIAEAEIRAAEGKADDAVRMLSEQLRGGGEGTDLLRAAQSMGVILQKFQAAPMNSVATLEDARFLNQDSELEPSLRILQAQTLVLNGLLAQAEKLVEPIAEPSLVPDQLGLEIVRLQSTVNGGQWGRARHHVDRTRELTDLPPDGALTNLVAFCDVLTELFLDGLGREPALVDLSAPAVGVARVLGSVLAGDGAAAGSTAERTAAQLGRSDPLQLKGMLAVLLQLVSRAGHDSRLPPSLTPGPSPGPSPEVGYPWGRWIDVLTAWNGCRTAALDGNPVVVDQLALASERAVSFGWVAAGLVGAHQMARFGFAEQATQVLLPAVSNPDQAFGPGGVGVTPVLLAHALATTQLDPVRLVDAGRGLAQRGWKASAADTFFHAASIFDDDGDLHSSLVSSLAGMSLAVALPVASLVPASRDVPAVTNREFDVIRGIAGGRTSKQVASLLHLSARTVDNHLYRLAGRFGLTRRSDLVTALLHARDLSSTAQAEGEHG